MAPAMLKMTISSDGQWTRAVVCGVTGTGVDKLLGPNTGEDLLGSVKIMSFLTIIFA